VPCGVPGFRVSFCPVVVVCKASLRRRAMARRLQGATIVPTRVDARHVLYSQEYGIKFTPPELAKGRKATIPLNQGKHGIYEPAYPLQYCKRANFPSTIYDNILYDYICGGT